MRNTPPRHSIPRRAGARIGAAVWLAMLITAICAPDTHAQGLFDFLLGGGQRQQPAPQPTQPLPPAPSPSVRPQYNESIAPGGTSQYHDTVGTGRGVTFCVRLCDGRYFPMERHSRVTPGQLCSAFCPASQTKVYSGSVISSAVAPDGSRYADLKTAYVYRK